MYALRIRKCLSTHFFLATTQNQTELEKFKKCLFLFSLLCHLWCKISVRIIFYISMNFPNVSLSLSASFCVRAVSPITFNLNFSADYTLVLLTYCELFWLCVFLENQNICKKLTCKNSAWMPCHLLTKIRIHEQRNEMIFDLFPMRCSIFVLIQDESVDATRVMGSHIRL